MIGCSGSHPQAADVRAKNKETAGVESLLLRLAVLLVATAIRSQDDTHTHTHPHAAAPFVTVTTAES